MNKGIENRKFCVAPMMGYTTPHARRLYRMLSAKTFLFTEMIATKTMLHSKNRDLIIENDMHNPIAVQVGGSEIDELKKCAKIAKQYNYDEINLNVGCPSKAVQKGSFGACLMKNKTLVRNSLEEMKNSSNIKVSIKCRIGIGKEFNYDFFSEFISEILKSEISIVYVHARNAILSGISPKANRNIPPLNYDFIKKIKLDKLFFNHLRMKEINERIILEYFNYIKTKINNESIFRLLSPMLQIFFGIPNSKKFKIDIHKNMQNHQIDKLETLFLQFIKQKEELIT